MIAAMTSASSFDPLALFIGLFLSVNYFAFCRFRLLPHMQSPKWDCMCGSGFFTGQ